MRWFAALILLGVSLPAQVEVYSGLGEAGDQQVRRLLEEQVPAGSVLLFPIGESWIPSLGSTALLLGVNGATLGELSGALVPVTVSDLEPPFLGPGGAYAITLLSPYVIAFNPDHLDPAEVPGRWDDLLDPRFQDRIAIASFQAMPDLWMTWIGRERRRDDGERRAVGWLTALDARVETYHGSAGDVLQALMDGRASLGVLPRNLLGSPETSGLEYVIPAEDIAAAGLGVARLGGERNPETELVLEVLLGASFNHELADGLQLLAAPRVGEDRAARSPVQTQLLAGLYPLELDPNLRRAWLEIWETEIRGRGRDLEGLSESLDLILGILLLAFLFFVYTRMRKEDRSDGTE